MSPHRRSIGALARESGLTVSALRFYDAAGVLRPARVDPGTGYRWYDADQVHSARLIARLRAASMPLPVICATLAARGDPAHAAQLLDGHLRRLEDSLADARSHLATARELLITKENHMTTLTVRGTDLAAAVAAVRFAVSKDPAQPALNGVLFDFDGHTPTGRQRPLSPGRRHRRDTPPGGTSHRSNRADTVARSTRSLGR